MMRWRTRGLIGVPTTDGRTITGPVTARPAPLPLLRVRKPTSGHVGAELVGATEVRVVGDEIQARLLWRHRRANLDLHATVDWNPDGGAFAVTLTDVVVVGLTIAGHCAWKGLP